MANKKQTPETAAAVSLVGAHGASRLPRVVVDGYNLELKDENGFLGDRASKKALYALLDKWRKPLAKDGKDPFGDRPSKEVGKKELDEALAKGDTAEAGMVHAVVEDFAQELAFILRRFLREKSWQKTERVVIGGGMRDHRIGELATGRAGLLLKAENIAVDLVPIHNDPDDAGLLGAVQLAPSWIFKGHDSILAVDIGGTNMRVGIVALNLEKSPDFAKAYVHAREIWRHRNDKTDRDEAVEELAGMLRKLIRRAAKEGLSLAPFVGIGCPGRIEPDGSIDRGAQNLPGNWESSRFHLPSAIAEAIPAIGEHETEIVMHNDAVVQGLSEVPFMTDVERWGVLTLGTGLGNARFTNRTAPNGSSGGK
ncbi:MAG TPA: ROK family protein [Rhizomicrobium sp.]